MNRPKIQIDPEICSLIPPPTPDELAGLEASINDNGCLDPLTVWGETGILLDGHHRLEICRRLKMAFDIREFSFPDRPSALSWVLSWQLNRRNLTPDQSAVLRGQIGQLTVQERGGDRRSKSKNSTLKKSTAEEVADQLGVSRATLFNDMKFAAAVDTLAEVCGPEARTAILSRESKLTRGDTLKLAKMSHGEPERAKEIVEAVLSGEACSVKRALAWQAAEKIEAEPPPLPSGQFRVIVIDPPWQYDKRAEDKTHRASLPYPSMSLKEIGALLIEKRAHADSILWLWTTNAHMEHAFGIARGWGFEPKTILTWVKSKMSTGDWLRGKTEHCLMCVRGKPTVTLTNQTTVIEGKVREHSRKPEEFYRVVEALCPGSKVEFFARSQRKGWESFGNDTERF